MEIKEFISIKTLADILGISRIAVFNKIKKGEIVAQKVGRSYIIPLKSLSIALGHTISEDQKKKIKEAVRKTVDEYGDVLKLLGKE